MTEDISRHVEAWTKDVKAKLQTLARCCILHLGPKWHGVVTSLSLSFHFILLASCLRSFSAARQCLQPADLGLHLLKLFFSLHFVSLSCSSCTLLIPVWNNEPLTILQHWEITLLWQITFLGVTQNYTPKVWHNREQPTAYTARLVALC